MNIRATKTSGGIAPKLLQHLGGPAEIKLQLRKPQGSCRKHHPHSWHHPHHWQHHPCSAILVILIPSASWASFSASRRRYRHHRHHHHHHHHPHRHHQRHQHPPPFPLLLLPRLLLIIVIMIATKCHIFVCSSSFVWRRGIPSRGWARMVLRRYRGLPPRPYYSRCTISNYPQQRVLSYYG